MSNSTAYILIGSICTLKPIDNHHICTSRKINHVRNAQCQEEHTSANISHCLPEKNQNLTCITNETDRHNCQETIEKNVCCNCQIVKIQWRKWYVSSVDSIHWINCAEAKTKWLGEKKGSEYLSWTDILINVSGRAIFDYPSFIKSPGDIECRKSKIKSRKKNDSRSQRKIHGLQVIES